MIPLASALWGLHAACAAVVVLVAAGCLAVGCRRPRPQKRQTAATRRQRRRETIAIGGLVLAYLAEGAATWTQPGSIASSPAHCAHLVCVALCWAETGVRVHRAAGEAGVLSLAALLFEAPLMALSPFGEFHSSVRLVLGFVFQTLRLVAFAGFLAATAWRWHHARQSSSRERVGGDDDEARPFLRASGPARSVVAGRLSYGAVPSSESDGEDERHPFGPDADSDADLDSDEDDEDRARLKRVRQKRLEETGGWWGYLQDFSIFLPFLFPRRDRRVQLCLLVSVLCLAARRAFNILLPRQLGIVADHVLGGEPPYGAMAVWLLLSLLSSDSGLGLVESLAQIPVRQFSYRQMTNAAFGHVMALSMDFHADRDAAEVMKAIEQGEALANVLEGIVVDIAPTAVDLVLAVGLLYHKFNAWASLVMLVAAGAFLGLEILTSRWNIGNRRRATKAQREETRVMHQAVQGWQTVACFDMFARERQRFGAAVEHQLAASRAWSVRSAYLEGLLELVVPTTLFLVACLAMHEIAQGRATGGDFVFLLQYWENLIWPLKFLSSNYRWMLAELVGAERLMELFHTKPSVADKPGAIDITRQVAGGKVCGRVEFRDVTFAYDASPPSPPTDAAGAASAAPTPTPSTPKMTLRGVNLTAQPGQTVALVGATGAGKSSITKLLLRFYDVTSGRITIDGHDVRDVTLSSLRTVLGVVPQDPVLFNASVRDNVRYARPGATDAEVEAACQAAAIHDDIVTRFARGYDTKVGEQGVKLSGGEVQRLAIARVFLKDPPILLLDEATSAVDTHTEWTIQQTLEGRLMKGRTTFVIAHRLSSVVRADQILVLEDGQIVESGTHEELLDRSGRYANLWAKQMAKRSKKTEDEGEDEDSEDHPGQPTPPSGSSTAAGTPLLEEGL